MRYLTRIPAIFLCLFLMGARANAASLTLAWDASPDATVTGYMVVYGSASRIYTGSVNAGKVTQFTVNNLTQGQLYYLSVQAYNAAGEMSDFANEVSAIVGVAPVSSPVMSLDSPVNNATVQGEFILGGWAIDLGAPTGSGVDALHVWAWPTTGAAPTWVGAFSTGGARADVGAAFGAQFAPSGFTTLVTLQPGTWDLVVYARSTVSGTFNNSRVARVNAGVPVTRTTIVIDTPRTGDVNSPLLVAGWAADLAVSSGSAGPGVDTIHVWAYPDPGSNKPAIFVGAATLRVPRPDVAGVFGAQFSEAGYALVVDNLVAGTYRLVTFARNTATGVFDTSASVDVTIR
jgi:hypothetical protein